MVVIYAIAMAWVESAVVFYLRSMINRIEPHQPDPFPIIGGFGWVELLREFSTIVMLFTVGVLAGRTWRARLGYFAIGFGVWDIFYYVFLKIICSWPHSLLRLGHFILAADAVVGAGARTGPDLTLNDFLGHLRQPV